MQWISWFLQSKGNEYFCEVEEDYILDRFNLTGLNTEVQNYSQALDIITDNLGVFETLRCFRIMSNICTQTMKSWTRCGAHWTSKLDYFMGSFTLDGS